MLADLKKNFTDGISSKLAAKFVSYFPLHIKYVTTRGSAVLSKSTAAPTKGWAGAGLAPSKSAPQCSRNVFQNSKNALLTCQKTLSKFQNDYSAEAYQIDSLHCALWNNKQLGLHTTLGSLYQGLKYLKMSTTHREGRWRGQRLRARHGGAKRRSAEVGGVWGGAP